MAYAVIRTGGKQYKVSTGDTLEVELLDAEQGGSLEFGEVLLVSDAAGVRVGRPLLEGAKVTADVVGHVRAPKVTSFKYVSKQGYHRTRGHRQPLTRVKITGITS